MKVKNAFLAFAAFVALTSALYAQPEYQTVTGISWPDGQLIDEAAFVSMYKTTVIKSDQSPTGYFVSFRYYGPYVDRVRIQGEWVFSSIDAANAKNATNATPFEWKDGYTLLTTKGWPVAEMKKNEKSGVWYYTIPLPNGTYKYKFYEGGKEETAVLKGSDEYWDQNHPPKIYDLQAKDLKGEDRYSAIYVPGDPIKQKNTADCSAEAPRSDKNGKITYVRMPSSDGTRTVRFGVYLPYGFDSQRNEPYPVMILLHGAGGTDASWFNNGASNIFDNLVAQGRMEPTIVITPNASDFSWKFDQIDDALINDILPYAVNNFNATKDVGHRAIAGLSMGGMTTMYTFANHSEAFKYFMPMSAPAMRWEMPDYSDPAMKEKKLIVAVGAYDFVLNEGYYDKFYGLKQAGIPYLTEEILPYDHHWTLWRQNLVYMIDTLLWK